MSEFQTTEKPNEHWEGKSELIGLVMLQDLIPILEEFTALDGDKYKATSNPTHGACCTCQDCGHAHDDCVCEHNQILLLLKLMPKFTASDIKLDSFRSGGFVNKEPDMGRLTIDLPIIDAKKLMAKISAI
jgi:hypothetical protein